MMMMMMIIIIIIIILLNQRNSHLLEQARFDRVEHIMYPCKGHNGSFQKEEAIMCLCLGQMVYFIRVLSVAKKAMANLSVCSLP